jgi:hypothetical protein
VPAGYPLRWFHGDGSKSAPAVYSSNRGKGIVVRGEPLCKRLLQNKWDGIVTAQ